MKSVSPTPKKKAVEKPKKTYAVFATNDVRLTWDNLQDARDIAKEFSIKYERSMQIFELVETVEKK